MPFVRPPGTLVQGWIARPPMISTTRWQRRRASITRPPASEPTFLRTPEEVPLGDRRVRPDDEVRPGEGVEVGRVVGDVEGRVEQLAEQLGGARRVDVVDRVGRLRRGHVVRLRADAADAVHEDRHLLDGPADAELLEAAQLGDLEVRPLDLAGVVEEDLDLAVALEARDRVDGDAGHRGHLPGAPASAGSGDTPVVAEASGAHRTP